jgi:hypothetical protein
MEGMDACSFGARGDGFEISGTALYLDSHQPTSLDYRVSCNSDWSSQSASVKGWVGCEKREFSISRDVAGAWAIDGVEIPGVDGLLDIDLGFTPATNTNAINRLRLGVGDEAETTAVWLDTDDWCFKPLTQVYRRLSETEFAYCSPSHDYTATLVTDDFGIIRLYPQLWTAISEPTCSDKGPLA